MTPHEFREWIKVFDTCPVDEWWGDKVTQQIELEQSAHNRAYEVGPEIAQAYSNAITWAAFWLAAGAVASVAIWRLA